MLMLYSVSNAENGIVNIWFYREWQAICNNSAKFSGYDKGNEMLKDIP